MPILCNDRIVTYFYTAITVNPTQMAEDMKKNGGFIPESTRKKTIDFLDIMSRITLLRIISNYAGICNDGRNR